MDNSIYYQLNAKNIFFVKDAILNIVNKYKFAFDKESYNDIVSYDVRSMNANGFYTREQRDYLIDQHINHKRLPIDLYENDIRQWYKDGKLTNLQNTNYKYKDCMPSYRTLLYLLDEGFRRLDLAKRYVQNFLYKKYGKKCSQWKEAQKSFRKVENRYMELVKEAHTETGVILDSNLNIIDSVYDLKASIKPEKGNSMLQEVFRNLKESKDLERALEDISIDLKPIPWDDIKSYKLLGRDTSNWKYAFSIECEDFKFRIRGHNKSSDYDPDCPDRISRIQVPTFVINKIQNKRPDLWTTHYNKRAWIMWEDDEDFMTLIIDLLRFYKFRQWRI